MRVPALKAMWFYLGKKKSRPEFWIVINCKASSVMLHLLPSNIYTDNSYLLLYVTVLASLLRKLLFTTFPVTC